MKAIIAALFLGVVLLVSGCGGCPSGYNTSDPYCPGYMGYYQQPYGYGGGYGYGSGYGYGYGQPQPQPQPYPYYPR